MFQLRLAERWCRRFGHKWRPVAGFNGTDWPFYECHRCGAEGAWTGHEIEVRYRHGPLCSCAQKVEADG